MKPETGRPVFEELAAMRRMIAELETLESEERRQREALEGKERFYRHLVEDSLGLMCAHDLEGTLLFINPAAAHSLGYQPEHGIGRNLREFLAPEVRHLFDQYLEQIRKNVTDSGLMRLVAKDGSERIWLYRNVRYEEPGVPPRVLGHALDITDRIRAEQAVKESEGRFRIMADTAPVMIWMSDAEGKCIFFNKPWLDFSGRRMEQDLDAGWLENVHSEDVQTCWDTYMAALRERQSFRMEYRVRRADGEYRWILDHGVPRFKSGGAFAGYVGSCIDVTDAKRDKESLKTANEELAVRVAERTADLQRANEQLQAEIQHRRQMEQDLLKARNIESLGVLAGGIAHDFNNILTILGGNLVLAKMFLEPDHPALEILADVERACQRAGVLTAQLLTFAKGGAPVRRNAPVAEIVTESVRLILRDSNVRCDIHVPEDIWPVHADVGQIGQAIQNVLLNCREAMPEGGTVQVVAENVAWAGDRLPLASGNYVKIQIRDEGSGIPPEILPRIFDPYFTTKKAGTGLGLATAYTIVARHEGYISAESTMGAGTSVSIYLPAAPEPAAEAKPMLEGPARASGRILVMDDEEAIGKLTAKLLGSLGYEVELARNGGEAIAAYEQGVRTGRPFGAVLLDLTVPGDIGGKEAVQRLREIDPGVKAIASSGYSDDPVMSDFRQYGFSGVVAKPWTLAQLQEAIIRAMSEG